MKDAFLLGIGSSPASKTVACRLVAISLLVASACNAQAQTELDQYGGLRSLNFGPGKCFRTHYDGQRWWLVTPDGGAFLSLGVNVVRSDGDTEKGTNRHPYNEHILQKYGSAENWAATTRKRLNEWGFNTLGNWSSREIDKVPYTLELPFSPGWGKNSVPDFFEPKMEEDFRNGVSGIEARADDPYLLGYYLANELPWGTDWRLMPNLFEGYMAMPPEAPGKKRLIGFFSERYPTLSEFNSVWNAALADWNGLGAMQALMPRDRSRARADREEFALVAARQYFKMATEAIRASDKNHLILGCRFIWATVPRPVVKACGEYCDVVSINYYEAGILGKLALALTAPDALRVSTDLSFKGYFDLANKPLLVTEFSFRAMDGAPPNTYPPPLFIQPTVANQAQRADKFENSTTTWMAQPFFLGYHWFQYMDEPAVGRAGDGENGNYGLVKIDDEPYTEFVERVKAVNRRVWELHAESEAKSADSVP